MNSLIWILLLLSCCNNNNGSGINCGGNGRSYDNDDYNGYNSARMNGNGNGCGCEDNIQPRNFSGFASVGTNACENNFDDNNNQNNNQ